MYIDIYYIMLYFDSDGDQIKKIKKILFKKNKNKKYYNHLECKEDLSKLILNSNCDKENMKKKISKIKDYKYK